MEPDRALFQWINGLAGRVPFWDTLFSGFADDYFILVAMCLILVAMWFGTRDTALRIKNQLTVLTAIISLGISSGLVSLVNVLFVKYNLLAGTWLNELCNRPRPFNPASGLTVNLLFYQPHDPSFPSNLAAVVFGIAIAVWARNKTTGTWLLGMALLACFARVFVGIHYPLDIVGGCCFGILGTLCALCLMKIFAPLIHRLMNLLKNLYLAG